MITYQNQVKDEIRTVIIFVFKSLIIWIQDVIQPIIPSHILVLGSLEKQILFT